MDRSEDEFDLEEPPIPGSIPIPSSGANFLRKLEAEKAAGAGNPDAKASLCYRGQPSRVSLQFATYIPQAISLGKTFVPFDFTFEEEPSGSHNVPSTLLPNAEEQNDTIYASCRLPKTNATRVLDLQIDGSQNASLSGTLRRVSITQPHDYIAFSYAWGSSPSETARITTALKLNGPFQLQLGQRFLLPRDGTLQLQIGQNIAAALRAFCRLWARWRPVGLEESHVPAIWADAICINQRDPEERFDQVMQMRSVYRNAHSLVIWLGPAAARYSTLLKRLERDSLHEILASETPAILQELCNDLTGREWFSRRWVIQEVAVSNQEQQPEHSLPESPWDYSKLGREIVQLYTLYMDYRRPNTYGSGFDNKTAIIEAMKAAKNPNFKIQNELHDLNTTSDLTPLDFLDLITRLREKAPAFRPNKIDQRIAKSKSRRYFLISNTLITFETLMDFIAAVGTIPRPMQPLTIFRMRNLLESLFLYDEAKCSDSRDRIYALYGISQVGNREDFRWHYQTTHIKLYEQVATMYAQTVHFPLLLLCALGRGLNDSSWIPDWTRTTLYESEHHRDAAERVYASLLNSGNAFELAKMATPGIISRVANLKSKDSEASDAPLYPTTSDHKRDFGVNEMFVAGWIIYPCRNHNAPDTVNYCKECSRYKRMADVIGEPNGAFRSWMSKMAGEKHCKRVILFLERSRLAFWLRRTEHRPRTKQLSPIFHTLDSFYQTTDCCWIPDEIYRHDGKRLYAALRADAVLELVPLLGKSTWTFTEQPGSLREDFIFRWDSSRPG